MARLPFRSIAVSGSSMHPTYNDGDWLVFKQVTATANDSRALLGRVVVIERESYPGIHFIKRVTRLEDDAFWVEGDNKESSTDSRQWGAITPTEIVGVVILRYKRG
jgi:nickel-type superoxide dismutase maturation protease